MGPSASATSGASTPEPSRLQPSASASAASGAGAWADVPVEGQGEAKEAWPRLPPQNTLPKLPTLMEKGKKGKVYERLVPTVAEPIRLPKDLGNRCSTCAKWRKALRAVTFALTHVFEADNVPIHNVRTSDERFLLGSYQEVLHQPGTHG